MITAARRTPAEAAEKTASPEGLPFRAAPHNLEAEQALLGAMLVNNEAHDRVSGFLDPQHFYDPLHQQIYETAAKLIANGKQATPITLKTFFETAEPIDATLTVSQYLGRLAANAATIINARDYGRTIYDLATRRQLILIGEDLVNKAYDSPIDFPPKEQIEEVETRLYALAEHGKSQSQEISASAMHAATIEMIERAYQNRGIPAGLSTGFKDLDAKMGRLQPSNLIIVAGRPAMGKTALATNIVCNQAGPVHFFSQEMTAEEVSLRLISEETGLPTDQLRRGDLDDGAWRRVLKAKDKLGQQPLIVDQAGALTIGQLTARARRIKRRHKTALIIIDYIQLMRGTKRTENRNLEVSEITGGLKALAKELDVPVIALSQLSRDVEKRPDKRPHLADLRDSGSIEQDADIVIFLYREEYYLEGERPSAGVSDLGWAQKMAQAAGKAEVIIAKHRHGQTGSIPLQFEATITRFSDLAFSSGSERGGVSA